MATTNATFRLICCTPEKQIRRLSFIHPMPSVLCVEPTEEIEAQIKPLLLRILCSHEAEILSISQ